MRILRTARVIVVPSEETALEVAEAAREAGMSRIAPIEVVTYGADHVAYPDTEAAEALLDGLGVHGAYVVCVGTLEPRKNLRRLVEAFGIACERLGEDWRLVVVGPEGWGQDTGEVRPPPGVVLTGPVGPELLSGLYARAAMAAYVPLFEGWGLPVVEAMALGVPVVSSPVPSAGDAALVVDPFEVAEIAEAIVGVGSDTQTREALIRAGTERVKPMTWKECARRHIAIWEAFAG